MEMITIPKHEYEALKALVATLVAELEESKAEIKSLKAQLSKNSNNSSKPPSSDHPGKKVKNSRIKSGKPNGGQPGHIGKTKTQAVQPDTIVELKPQTECACGGHVIINNEAFLVRQQEDLQPAKVITVEYHAHDGKCDCCGKEYKASFPTGVDSPVSYGPNLRGVITYLNVYQLLPLKRTTEMIKHMYDIDISQGTIMNIMNEAHANLAPVEARIKDEIIQSNVVCFDESGMRVCAQLYWLHSASTEENTVYFIHPKRGRDAMDEMGILPVFTGTAIHDHWKSYYHYLCAHAECNAHHLRHLQWLFEDLGYEWAGEMICLLLRIKRHVELSHAFDANSLPNESIDEYENAYRKILAIAGKIESPHIESKRMVNRMTEYEQEALLFMYDFDVPFTNNLAERDIRMPKLKQKISGGFRSEDGANAFARIRSFVSTAIKRGKDVYEGLVAVFSGDAYDFLFT
jgi:transposase